MRTATAVVTAVGLVGALGLAAAGASAAPADGAPPPSLADATIPQVAGWEAVAGTTVLDESWRIVVPQEQADLTSVEGGSDILLGPMTVSGAAQGLSRDLREVTDLDLPVGTGEAGPGDIGLRLDPAAVQDGALGSEGYRLEVTGDRISVVAGSASGLYYGGRTLLQALRSDPELREIGNGAGVDVPDTAVRPYTLDVSREYWTVREVEDVIRQMGWLKQNVLIFHMDDAEYFRLDSPRYPGLAEPEFSYDEAEIAEIVRVGRENGVTVVPAFEFPAHLSHRAAYFHIGMGDGPIEVEPGFGERDTGATPENTCGDEYSYPHLTSDFTMNFMNPKGLDNARETLDEFVPWFDSPWVHIGGDEVPPRIPECPALQTWMAEQADPNLRSVSGIEQTLINQLNGHLKGMGKRTVVYSGFDNSWPAGRPLIVDDDVIVQVWTGDENRPALRPYDRIMGHSDDYYLVPGSYGTNPAKIYRDSRGYGSSDDNVLGFGMHTWGDDHGWAQGQFFESMAYGPRAATAERSWNLEPGERDFASFTGELLPRVGPAPFYVGEVEPTATTDARPVHAWQFAEASFPPGLHDAHGPNHRRALVETCGLSGMTKLNAAPARTTDPDQGPVQGGTFWFLGAPDLTGDWSFSATLRRDDAQVRRLLGSMAGYPALRPDGSIAGLPDGSLTLGPDGLTVVGPGGEHLLGASIPTGAWVDLTVTHGDAGLTLYVDGAPVASVDAAVSLPQSRIGDTGLTWADARVYAQELSGDEVREQHENGAPEPACQPAVAPVDAPLPGFGVLPPRWPRRSMATGRRRAGPSSRSSAVPSPRSRPSRSAAWPRASSRWWTIARSGSSARRASQVGRPSRWPTPTAR
ncbi:hypothetical protein GCM10025875_19910 [Litorihabitans aurantiacus]|uniref:beta-N-acetylhexosaminidase n=1 Tax=Litorihabitans aurantiacus TaxID=1930061 RepID=A0AA37XF70_9MICO|nr:hypothetical protein GCM10025875_19910 [Litorihabitans aurantiacus]